MQIVGIGTDIVSVARIKSLLNRYEEKALSKLFLVSEVEYCKKFLAADERFAGRYAAKEAIAKALGTGMSGGVSFTGIEIIASSDGAPQVVLLGSTLEVATRKGICSVLVSISHEADYAVAFAIAYGGEL